MYISVRTFLIYMIVLIGLSVPAQAQVHLNVGGFSQTWLLADYTTYSVDEQPGTIDRNTWGFRMQGARLLTRADLGDMLRVVAWTEFANANPSLLDFYITARFHPLFNLTLGQFRTPLQMHNASRMPTFNMIFYDRPMAATAISGAMGHDRLRDVGIMGSGTVGSLWYGIYLGNGLGRFSSAGGTITEREIGDALYGIRTDIEIADGVFFGGHIARNNQSNIVENGNYPYSIDRTSYSLRTRVDELLTKRIFAEAEYGFVRTRDNQEFDGEGFYVETGYTMRSDFDIVARYEQYERRWSGDYNDLFENITFGGLYYYSYQGSEFARVGLYYRYGDESPQALSRNSIVLWVQVRFLPGR